MKSREVSDIPDDLQREFDEIINRFEDVWQRGQRPDIADFVPGNDRLHLAVLRELVLIDLEYRCKGGEQPETVEYLAPFPELKAAVGFVESLNGVLGRFKPAVESTASLDTVVSDQSSVDDADNIRIERIGRYRVERVLGKGGFGLVFLAYDETLERHVAVKVSHARLVSRPEDAAAYLTEARTVASLDHPHIVAVYDVGSTEQFPCYVVSKYIDGTDLSTRSMRSRLNLKESVELVATVAEALHYAHKRGLVHRDIKPGNILIDKSGMAFVTDFGLALREQDLGKGPRYAGTPAYMSPEQARGEGHRVDGRSDIFSLAAVLYELLVGRRPFIANTSGELLKNISQLEPKPPRQIDDTIPMELERICLKALSKQASERYSTAKDMAADLRTWLNGKAPTRWKAIVGAVAGVVIMGMISWGALSIWPGPPRPLERDSNKADADQSLSAIPATTEPLRVLAIEVSHFATTTEGDVPRGILGQKSFTPLLGDRVQVKARLSQPAYAYLIAFRPDGVADLCFPESEDTIPPLTDAPRYPLVNGLKAYGLREGTGLWIFAVVASENPLPAYRTWYQERFGANSIWKPMPTLPPGIVWWDNGHGQVSILTAADSGPPIRGGERGKNEFLGGPAKIIAELTGSLQLKGEAETASAIGFCVVP